MPVFLSNTVASNGLLLIALAALALGSDESITKAKVLALVVVVKKRVK